MLESRNFELKKSGIELAGLEKTHSRFNSMKHDISFRKLIFFFFY